MGSAMKVLGFVEEFNAADRESKMQIAEAVLGPARIKEMSAGC